jgi:hypothetical protein
VAVIRTDHYKDSLAPGVLNRWLLTRLADGVVTFSERSQRRLTQQFRLTNKHIERRHELPGLCCSQQHRLAFAASPVHFVVKPEHSQRIPLSEFRFPWLGAIALNTEY